MPTLTLTVPETRYTRAVQASIVCTPLDWSVGVTVAGGDLVGDFTEPGAPHRFYRLAFASALPFKDALVKGFNLCPGFRAGRRWVVGSVGANRI